MKHYRLAILLLFFPLVLNTNISHAAPKEKIVEDAFFYDWGDVVAVNAYLDREYSIKEIKEMSGKIKRDIYYRHDLKRFPVCVINYFSDKNSIRNKVDPWEAKGWKYQYVINKQMKSEFLYVNVKGKIQRIQ